MIPVIIPFIVNGIEIIKFFQVNWDHHFAAPMSKTAFTPIELTRNEPNKKVTQAATIPRFAAPIS